MEFHSPWTIGIDMTRPWMIEIGNNVCITAGCSILTHGYDWCVLKKMYGEVLGSSGKVKIGNNVFIGQRTTILKGVTIGDNVIIGANSLVNKDCLKAGVYAGNPVRYISSLEDYLLKRQNMQVNEARELVLEYRKTYGVYPPKEILREFFWIFEQRNNEMCECFEDVMKLQGNRDESMNVYRNRQPIFDGYEGFIEYVEKGVKDEG